MTVTKPKLYGPHVRCVLFLQRQAGDTFKRLPTDFLYDWWVSGILKEMVEDFSQVNHGVRVERQEPGKNPEVVWSFVSK